MQIFWPPTGHQISKIHFSQLCYNFRENCLENLCIFWLKWLGPIFNNIFKGKKAKLATCQISTFYRLACWKMNFIAKDFIIILWGQGSRMSTAIFVQKWGKCLKWVEHCSKLCCVLLKFEYPLLSRVWSTFPEQQFVIKPISFYTLIIQHLGHLWYHEERQFDQKLIGNIMQW